jgi:hypothetical protein
MQVTVFMAGFMARQRGLVKGGEERSGASRSAIQSIAATNARSSSEGPSWRHPPQPHNILLQRAKESERRLP